MFSQQDLILIGELIRTHGKMGELQCRTINSYWDDSEAHFIILMLDHIFVPFRVIDWRYKGEDLLFTIKGINAEQQALHFVGSAVYMLRSDISQSNETDILCWRDIVGYTINGCPIIEIDDSTANILAIMQDGRLIPLHEDLIIAIDHTKRTLQMNLPEGL